MNKVSLRASRNAAGILLRMLFDHPMESGLRSDTRGTVIPPWCVQSVTVELDGKHHTDLQLSTGLSRNPVIAIQLGADATGAEVRVSWQDSRNELGSRSMTLLDL